MAIDRAYTRTAATRRAVARRVNYRYRFSFHHQAGGAEGDDRLVPSTLPAFAHVLYHAVEEHGQAVDVGRLGVVEVTGGALVLPADGAGAVEFEPRPDARFVIDVLAL